jgi:hypothetical protein
MKSPNNVKSFKEFNEKLNISDVRSSKINENVEMEQLIQNYIKNNLKIEIREKESRSDVSYSRSVYIDLILNDEVISTQEIPGIGDDY